MREFIAAMLLVWLIGLIWFPQSTANGAHKIYNDLKIGWESVK